MAVNCIWILCLSHIKQQYSNVINISEAFIRPFCITFKNWNEIILNVSEKRTNFSIEFFVVSILLTKRTYKEKSKAFIETNCRRQRLLAILSNEINILGDRQYQRRQLYLTTSRNQFYSNIRYKYKTNTIILDSRLTACLH